jgi:hypothetical protein
MAREGGVSVVSIDRPNFPQHFRQFFKFFKGPRQFNKQKTIMSGKTTPQGALLNQGACGVNN